MIYIYFIFILFYSIISLKKAKSKILIPILSLYLIGSFSAIILAELYGFNQYISLNSVVFHLLIIVLFIHPVVVYSKQPEKPILGINQNMFNLISWFLIILGFISIVFFIPAVIKALSGNIGENRSALVHGKLYIEVGLLNTVSGTIAMFYPITILFYFYSTAFLNYSKLFNNLLFFSSFSYVFYVLAYVGRDGIIFWSFSFLFNFFLFEPYLSKKQQKKIFRMGLLFLLFLGFILIIITISRFGERKDKGTITSIIEYLGSGFNYFGEMFQMNEHNLGKTNFPLIFGSDNKTVLEGSILFMNKYHFQINVFRTFVSDFYREFGSYSLIIFSFIYSLFISNIFKGKYIHLPKLILLTLVYQIPFHNYFYFTLGTRVGNLYLVSSLALSIFLLFNVTKVIAQEE